MARKSFRLTGKNLEQADKEELSCTVLGKEGGEEGARTERIDSD